MRRALFLIVFALPPTLGACSKDPTPPATTPPASCPVTSGGPTSHSTNIFADETWTADKSPHVIAYDTTVTAKVTLEPCVVVRIAPRVTVTVALKGSILGLGTETQPIVIGARDEGKAWAAIRAFGGSVHLAYSTIEGGGDPLSGAPTFAGMVLGQAGSDPAAVKEGFSFQNVLVRGSITNGIVLTGDARFSADSSALTVSGSALYPVSLFPRAVGSLPTGNFKGNGQDEILLPGSGVTEDIIADTTMHERGVPYHVGHATSAGQLRVGTTAGAPVATLTIEAGVVVRFKRGGVFEIEKSSGTLPASGALVARGTEAKPILFTSAEASPARGDWIGLAFGSVADPNTVLDHVVIEYAGKETTGGSESCMPGVTMAAIGIYGGQPAKAFVTNTKIAHSNDGFNCGWRGAQLDFGATNLFDDVARCKQTNPKDPLGNCAGRPECAF
jgi:hypothetical protein